MPMQRIGPVVAKGLSPGDAAVLVLLHLIVPKKIRKLRVFSGFPFMASHRWTPYTLFPTGKSL